MNKNQVKKLGDQVSGYLLGFSGALWGLTALGRETHGRDVYNPVHVAADLAGVPGLETGFYTLLGLAGLYQVYFMYRLCSEITYS
nr:MAG: hypothetical protein J07AB56_08860 [Candidatus Nanosalinarum sp. J07AB56]